MMPDSPFEGVEGDLNLSPHRAEWMRDTDDRATGRQNRGNCGNRFG